MSKQQIIELEAKLAFQEKAIDEMSEVIFKLNQDVDQLQRLYKKLADKFTAISAENTHDFGPHHQKPPHY